MFTRLLITAKKGFITSKEKERENERDQTHQRISDFRIDATSLNHVYK